MMGNANLSRFFGLERRLLLLLSSVDLVVHANDVSPCHMPILCALHAWRTRAAFSTSLRHPTPLPLSVEHYMHIS